MKIGLMLPIGQQELLAGPDRWSLFRDMALAAEASGLDSVWCAHHLLLRHDETAEPGGTDGIHEAWTILSAVAAITNRVEIGPLVLCVPFRNPALTAKMATTLDEVSGGRLILGLGCGWHEPEFDAFGYEFDHRVSQFAEALEIIVPMLRSGTATFDGRWQHAADARLAPPGLRSDGPSILIAGKGPRMLELVARHADAWNSAWYGHPDEANELRERISRLHAALDSAGRPRDSLELTAGIFVAASPADDDRPEETITGSLDEIAEALAGYGALGVTHLIVHLWPRTVEAVEQLGAAAAIARERAGPRKAAV
jgi:probable F420-dependent oxidoreductase